MKKIVISGYYGFDNLGDEAILFALLKTIRAMEPSSDCIVLSNQPHRTAQDYAVEASPRWPLSAVKKALKDCSLFITGGGSLLQDSTSNRSIPYYLGLMSRARRMGAKTALFSCGVGPIERKWLRFVTRRALNGADFVSVRDEDSRVFLDRLGVKRQIHRIPDPVLALDVPNAQSSDELFQREGIQKEGPRIVLAPRAQPNSRGYSGVWVECLRLLREREAFQCILWPMHGREDLELCQDIARRSEGAIVLEARYSPLQALDLLKGVDLMIGVRLHALILGAVAGCSLMGISYDPKVSSFLRSIDLLADVKLENMKPDVVADRAYRAWQYQEEIRDKVQAALPSLRREITVGYRNLLDIGEV